MRLRMITACAVGVLLCAAAPQGHAAVQADVLTISGVAGGQTVLRLPRAVQMERTPQDRIHMGSGDYAAVTLVQLGVERPFWYARHRKSEQFACGGVAGCFTPASYEDEVTSSDLRPSSGPLPAPSATRLRHKAAGSPALPGLRIPAGRYAVTLLGQPGERVSVRLRAGGLGAARTLRANRTGRAVSRQLPTVTAGAGAWQVADATNSETRVFEGFLIGIGYGTVQHTAFDACLGADPRPAAAGCNGDGRFFASSVGDTGESGLGYTASLNILSPDGQVAVARAAYTCIGAGGGMRAVRYTIQLPQ